ncbi:unnamed protein product [Ectocarpus sp. 4 AP-2014]
MPPMQPEQQPKRRRRRRRPGEEEEPVLRTTCDACTSAKVKCNGEKPCVRCSNKNIQCEYTFKKRCGPKRRKGVSGDKNGGLLAPYPDGVNGSKVAGLNEHLRGEPTTLDKDEVECVDVFMQNINSFLPLTTMDTVKRAAKATAPAAGGGECSEEEEDQRNTETEERSQFHHAGKAMLYGAIALGAEFLEKEEVSVTRAVAAREEIKECFDAAAPELVAAHLILALYWTHQMDSSKINRYIGLAHQSNDIISDSPGALVASLTFVSVILYDAKVVSSIGCLVKPPGSSNRAGIPSSSNPAACQERVLNILSYVLLAIHNRSSRSNLAGNPAMSTGDWDPKAMTEHIYEAKALLDKGSAGGGPNDISRCIVVVLQAYFLLLTNNRRQAIVITEPLADLVADNPLVLHLPIVWSLVGCVRVLLDGADRTIAVERLQSAMAPLANHLGFSTDESLVEQELMSVFNGKQGLTKRKGATTAPSAAAAAAAASAAASQDLAATTGDILVRSSRAQTSSLNVTAQDYSHRGRSAINMLALEPSPAPRRRGLPTSATRQGVSAAAGGGGGVATSLLSAAMVSSGEPPVEASSPPPSRAGALTRLPAARGGPLSIPAPFVPKQSMLQLDMPFMGSSFLNNNPSAAVQPGTDGVSVMIKRDLGLPQQGGHAAAAAGGGEPRESDEALLDKLDASRAHMMREQREQQQSFSADAPVPSLDEAAGEGDGAVAGLEDEDGRQQSFKADAPVNLDDGVKLGEDRRELMAKQQVQQSFVADAPVSLEQVESNMARLGVSHPDDEDQSSRIVTSMDLEVAAELLATKTTSFIS